MSGNTPRAVRLVACEPPPEPDFPDAPQPSDEPFSAHHYHQTQTLYLSSAWGGDASGGSALRTANGSTSNVTPTWLNELAVGDPGEDGGIGLTGMKCVQAVQLDSDPYTVTVHGFVSPVFVLLTIVCNCLFCAVLLKPHMRSCTNALLVAMAVSDTMTGVLPVPCFLYFYTTGPARYLDYMPYGWCFAFFCLTDYLPTITHTASVWLTVALAVHRYVFVCHPGRAKRYCTMPNVSRTIGVVYVAAVISHLCRFAEHQYTAVDVPSSTVAENLTTPGFSAADGPNRSSATVTGAAGERGLIQLSLENLIPDAACYNDFSPFVLRYQNVYFNVYYWFRVVCIHLVPCTTLVVLNVSLVGAIRSARYRRLNLLLLQNHYQDHPQDRRRSSQLQQRRRSPRGQPDPQPPRVDAAASDISPTPAAVPVDDASQQTSSVVGGPCPISGGSCTPFRRLHRRQSNMAAARGGRRTVDAGSSTTLMLVIVVGVFLLVEFPLAVLFIVMITENTFNVPIMSSNTSGMASLVLNLVTLISYPVNFFIYCAMSEQFRRTFRGLFAFGCCVRRQVGIEENGAAGADVGRLDGHGGAPGAATFTTFMTGRSCCGGGPLGDDVPLETISTIREPANRRERLAPHGYISMIPVGELNNAQHADGYWHCSAAQTDVAAAPDERTSK